MSKITTVTNMFTVYDEHDNNIKVFYDDNEKITGDPNAPICIECDDGDYIHIPFHMVDDVCNAMREMKLQYEKL